MLGLSNVFRRPVGRPSVPVLDIKVTQAKFVKVLRRYLKDDGWNPLELAPFCNVWVRAEKNSLVLNLMVHECGMGWRTLIADAAQASFLLKGVVGLVSAGKAPGEMQELTKDRGIFVIDLENLPNIDKFISVTALGVKEREIKSLTT